MSRLDEQRAALLQAGWLGMGAHDPASQAYLAQHFGLTVAAQQHGLHYSQGFLLLPLNWVYLDEGQYHQAHILFALRHDILISIEQAPQALACARLAVLDTLQQGPALPPARHLFNVLVALNQQAHSLLAMLATALGATHPGSQGYEAPSIHSGVADIATTAVALGEAEELVANVIQAQLMLARACRWLRRRLDDDTRGAPARALLADIGSARRHALFQHGRVRHRQQSLMTTLDIKQNQIIRIFTVVTAVFTPPTLVASFYGQNFAYMPELELPWGEWMVMALTALFALLPLVYIKRKGWLR